MANRNSVGCDCNPGFFESTGKCEQCSNNCNTCAFTCNNCLSCKINHILLGSKCVFDLTIEKVAEWTKSDLGFKKINQAVMTSDFKFMCLADWLEGFFCVDT